MPPPPRLTPLLKKGLPSPSHTAASLDRGRGSGQKGKCEFPSACCQSTQALGVAAQGPAAAMEPPETPVKDGILYQQHVKFGKKSWRKVWGLLYAGGPSGVARLESWEVRDGGLGPAGDRPAGPNRRGEPRVIRLADCVSVLPVDCESCPRDTGAFLLTTTERSHLLAAQHRQAWMGPICQLAFPGTGDCATGAGEAEAPKWGLVPMEENSIYSSLLEVDKFPVVVQRTEAATRCHLKGSYVLLLSQDAIQLSEPASPQALYTWPYHFLRKFGSDKLVAAVTQARASLPSAAPELETCVGLWLPPSLNGGGSCLSWWGPGPALCLGPPPYPRWTPLGSCGSCPRGLSLPAPVGHAWLNLGHRACPRCLWRLGCMLPCASGPVDPLSPQSTSTRICVRWKPALYRPTWGTLQRRAPAPAVPRIVPSTTTARTWAGPAQPMTAAWRRSTGGCWSRILVTMVMRPGFPAAMVLKQASRPSW
ncbi:docking protein 3 isoform X2 [Phyllostomus discolor]|uniref:Docking protein 3 isoform X2 n=1 Tax=Phyllostomus discolor TaxID=89673 RepID=A0A7E6CTY8_9CHIR|nr:docking protein 3 isoform X2 [Phyllostomus discolor]